MSGVRGNEEKEDKTSGQSSSVETFSLASSSSSPSPSSLSSLSRHQANLIDGEMSSSPPSTLLRYREEELEVEEEESLLMEGELEEIVDDIFLLTEPPLISLHALAIPPRLCSQILRLLQVYHRLEHAENDFLPKGTGGEEEEKEAGPGLGVYVPWWKRRGRRVDLYFLKRCYKPKRQAATAADVVYLLLGTHPKNLHPSIIKALRDGTCEDSHDIALSPSEACQCLERIFHSCGKNEDSSSMKIERSHSEGEPLSQEGVAARDEQDGYKKFEIRENEEEEVKNCELLSSSSSPWRGRKQQSNNPFLEDDYRGSRIREEEKECERDRKPCHRHLYPHSKEGETEEDREVCKSQDRLVNLEQGRDDVSHNETKKRRSEAKNECASSSTSWCICRYIRHVKVPSVSPVTPQQQRKWNEVWPCYLNKTKPPPSGSPKGVGEEERDYHRCRSESSFKNALSTTLPEGVTMRARRRGDATEGAERHRDSGEKEGEEKVFPAEGEIVEEEEKESKKEVRRRDTSRGREEEWGRLKGKKEEERDKESQSTAECYGMRQELLIPLQLTPEEKEKHKLYLQAAVRLSRETGRSACIITYTPKSSCQKGVAATPISNTNEKEKKSMLSNRKRSRTKCSALSPPRAFGLNTSPHTKQQGELSTAASSGSQSRVSNHTDDPQGEGVAHSDDARKDSSLNKGSGNSINQDTCVIVNGCSGQLIQRGQPRQGAINGDSMMKENGKERESDGDRVMTVTSSLQRNGFFSGFMSQDHEGLWCGDRHTSEKGECYSRLGIGLKGASGSKLSTTRIVAACVDTSEPAHPLCHAPMNAIGAVGRQLVERAQREGCENERNLDTVQSSTGCEGVAEEKCKPHTPSNDGDSMGTTEEDEVSDGNYYCQGCTVYCSHEPCVMCAMALVHSRINMLVFYHKNEEHGGITKGRLHLDRRLNHGYRVLCFKRK
ncbi:cytidine and deoxycytidylate deaminase zinc-binding region domain-containing protein [Cystoisospora suis]|uniref:Cytidine and deoxycytidylate deaminase zinc-binding region domain-containing protein n=1 Tax=Cystoisospora suis TaxID=483139 RepID=A0A2C6KTN9_9APIC|nr:cytidine and deoxycytidylate deaminase zinc-binding region domain-containing protein [Cystoisospora suis]